MMILHILTDLVLQFGRCKTRAKTNSGFDYFFPEVKWDLINFEIEFEFFCRTFWTCSKPDEIRGTSRSSERFPHEGAPHWSHPPSLRANPPPLTSASGWRDVRRWGWRWRRQ